MAPPTATTSTATAQAISVTRGPVIVQRTTMTSATDVRDFALTIAPGDLRKHIRVLTEAGPGGDANTDVAIDITGLDGRLDRPSSGTSRT